MSTIEVETAIEILPREGRTLVFRTDHRECDDTCLCTPGDAEFTRYWRRTKTKTFDGYVGRKTEECPGCNRRFRMRIPFLLFMEARLR